MGLNKAAIDRLRITEARIAEMAEGIRQVADLEDPVGRIDQRVDTPERACESQKCELRSV